MIKLRRMGGAGHAPRGAFRVVEGTPGRKRTLRRHRCRCENIKIGVKEMALNGVERLISAKTGTSSGFRKHGSETSDTIKSEKISVSEGVCSHVFS